MVDLYPHQLEAVKKMKNGCILWGGVGSGKSRTAIAYYMQNEAPKDIYIITTAKKRDSLDWDSEAIRYGIGREAGATVAGILKVDSWNNIAKYEGVKDAFFIFDEQRLVGAGAWTKSFFRIAKANRWVLLSATPGDTWLDYIPVFVANGYFKNRTEFKREHVVYNNYSKFPKVDRYIATGKLVRLRNELLVHMPYTRHTVRIYTDVVVDYDERLMERVTKDRWHVYENRPLKDVGELYAVARKVANSDESRMTAVSQLISKHPRLIVFYSFDYELENLRRMAGEIQKSREESKWTGTSITPHPLITESTVSGCITAPSWGEIGSGDTQTSVSVVEPHDQLSLPKPTSSGRITTTPSGIICTTSGPPTTSTTSENGIAPGSRPEPLLPITLAEWNGHKHEEIPDSESWIYLVQYTAGSEGWNCTSTDTVVFYSQTYSYKVWEQSKGRIDRLNTQFVELYYYNLVSKSWIDIAVKKAILAKESFNEPKGAF